MCFLGDEKVCTFDGSPLTTRGASYDPPKPRDRRSSAPDVVPSAVDATPTGDKEGLALAETGVSSPVAKPKAATHGPGTVIAGKYRIVSELGKGTTGTVFLAEQELPKRKVAVKLLNQDYSDDIGGLKRFKVEAKTASRLQHPNVVSVLDFGQESDGRYFLAMEYVEGKSLGELIAESGALPQLRVAHIFEQLLSAVSLAHNRSILHRDLKPDNILCTRQRGDNDFIKIVSSHPSGA